MYTQSWKMSAWMIKSGRLSLLLIMIFTLLLSLLCFVPQAFAADESLYKELNWRHTDLGYWNSNNGAYSANPQVITTADNSVYFLSSKRFTRAELPVGSIIEVDDGYTYRPEGWVAVGTAAPGRPGLVTTQRVVIDEAWWAGFEHRAFNVAKSTLNVNLTGKEEETASHFRIYVPAYQELDWHQTDLGYWNSNNGAYAANPQIITTADNSVYFLASKRFTRAELPVGSIIEVDAGYAYRPEGWVTSGTAAPGRPGMVTTQKVVIDEAWWGSFEYRAFNVARSTLNVNLTGQEEGTASHFRIYTPITQTSQMQHTVTYNFSENGGTAAGTTSAQLSGGVAVSLTPTATKANWTFLGWNTDKDATTALTSYIMPSNNVTLYAIFERTLTATLKDFNGTAATTRTVTVNIYNRATSGAVTMPSVNAYTGWSSRGWTTATAVDASPLIVSGSYTISDNATFYGLYQRTMTVSYNANGGSSTPADQSVIQYANSQSIAYSGPTIKLAEAISRPGYTFDGWVSSATGNKFAAGANFPPVAVNTTMTAAWKADNSIDYSLYKDLTWRHTDLGYWNSGNGGYASNPQITTTASNSVNFLASQRFSRADLPVGSIIEVDAGYAYRPEGWVSSGTGAPGRPDTVTTQRVVVDEAWWGSFEYRAFNILKSGLNVNLTGQEEETASHFRIYVPIQTGGSDTVLKELNWRHTDLGYWNSNNGGYAANPQITTTADNSVYFLASQRFSRAELPVGSIIEVDAGYAYRPDGWVAAGTGAPGRPGLVTTQRVVIDKAWWGNYEYRAFNILKNGYNVNLTGQEGETASHFRIYIPTYSPLDWRYTGD